MSGDATLLGAASLPDLLRQITVKAFVPGRIRFHLDFKGDAFLRDAMRRELQRIHSVRLASYSSRTRTALVFYDPDQVKPVDVAEAICRGVKDFARVHGECDLRDHRHEIAGIHRDANGEHSHHHHHHDDHAGHDHHDDHGHDHQHLGSDEAVRKETLRLGAVGAVLGWLVSRRLRGVPVLGSGGPLTDLAMLLTVVSGYPIFKSGAKSAAKGKPTDDTLIAIAVMATLLLRESLTGLSVVWLIQLGRLLEEITLRRSRLAIADFMDLAPPEAWKLSPAHVPGGKPGLHQTPVERLEKSDVVRIFHFEKVPLDGKVVAGVALVQESFLTGEALPKEKRAGDTVYAGSIVESGEIDVEVTSLVHETLIARMVAAVQDLQERRAPIEAIGNRFASRFVPISLGLAGITLLLTRNWTKAITMLVIACPCAAGLATPTAVFASIGGAAKRGILIKGGLHLEGAAHVDAVVLDKTGTLTVGSPKLVAIRLTHAGAARGENECVRFATAVERHATHPLAAAIVREARERGLEPAQVVDYVPHPGFGVAGLVDGVRVQIGSRAFLQRAGIAMDGADVDPLPEVRAAQSLVHLALDGAHAATFAVADAVRPEARAALEQVRKLGVKRILLATGDRDAPARYVAEQLGIIEVHSEMLPQDKFDLIDKLRAEGHRVAMVGDGINDAQALAHADVSIAMGEGRCDLAIETADVTLARNDLFLVPEALGIAKNALRTIHENFAASIGVNLVGLGFGALGRLSPFSAAIVHNLSTIAVVLNSFALQKRTARATRTDLGLLETRDPRDLGER
ncbi:cation-translocating P-type ATPase [Pendulispora rubella]|uniref:P-type Zn(2+) transporter n=1 Tax=Pendulispora rubella TaxID=2741070 RepID=A0ABZ2LGB1_9BACT